MNAAFLLVTSALLVGQAADKKPAPPPPPAAAAASCAPACGCDTAPTLRDRLKGLFSRDCSDSCKPTTCHTHHVHTPFFKKSCDECAKPKLFTWTPREKHCAPACSDPCDRPNLLAKLRERFQRSDKCCDTGCTAAPAMAPPVKGPEKIDPPAKKLPVDPGKGKVADEVRLETNSPAPVAPNVINVNPQIPAVDITPVPAPAPRIGGDRRDPF